MIRVVESAANELRLAEARAFIRSELRNGDLLLVAASRGAADDLARSIAIESGATLGLMRTTPAVRYGVEAAKSAANTMWSKISAASHKPAARKPSSRTPFSLIIFLGNLSRWPR